ncbi:hypothetical protein L596_004137 [Steinernema carpocapsae]|uniref:Protein kinase domain-containing protein n=1 Tax=Steinernema carpocapsae TaxID=34508 RepID=A0A4U8UUV1_STECR|nr:hypothetical protein L596_004137 [Steinernema carpocapsae]
MKHKCIAQIYDAFQTSTNDVILIMEIVEGTLRPSGRRQLHSDRVGGGTHCAPALRGDQLHSQSEYHSFGPQTRKHYVHVPGRKPDQADRFRTCPPLRRPKRSALHGRYAGIRGPRSYQV